jgi:uncharacterized protein YqgV (UPF0045/DUF77 family)
MPGYNRDELSVELRVGTSARGARSPQQQVEAAREAAGATGLAHEGGPDTTVLSGGRTQVLEAVRKVIDATLDAGAHTVEVKVEAQGDAPRFGS